MNKIKKWGIGQMSQLKRGVVMSEFAAVLPSRFRIFLIDTRKYVSAPPEQQVMVKDGDDPYATLTWGAFDAATVDEGRRHMVSIHPVHAGGELRYISAKASPGTRPGPLMVDGRGQAECEAFRPIFDPARGAYYLKAANGQVWQEFGGLFQTGPVTMGITYMAFVPAE